MNLAEFHERVCEPPLAQGEEKVRVTAALLCFDILGLWQFIFKGTYADLTAEIWRRISSQKNKNSDKSFIARHSLIGSFNEHLHLQQHSFHEKTCESWISGPAKQFLQGQFQRP